MEAHGLHIIYCFWMAVLTPATLGFLHKKHMGMQTLLLLPVSLAATAWMDFQLEICLSPGKYAASSSPQSYILGLMESAIEGIFTACMSTGQS